MTRIAAATAQDFKFQLSDTPPARTQKLELLRLEIIDTAKRATNTAPSYILADGLQALDVALFPESLPPMLIGREVPISADSAGFEYDQSIVLGTRNWLTVGTGKTFEAEFRARLFTDGDVAGSLSVGFMLYSSGGLYLGSLTENLANSSWTVADGAIDAASTTTSNDILTAFPTAVYVRAFILPESNGGTYVINRPSIADVTINADASAALADAEAAAAAALSSAIGAAASNTTAAGYASSASASASTATGQASAATASAVAAQSYADDADTFATASSVSASAASTSATAAGSSASAANTSRIAAEAANTAATASASAASSSAASASSSASTATTQATLSSTFATNSLNSLLANNPRGMAGGADWYTGSPALVFGTDGGVPVINYTSGSNGDIYPKWAFPAVTGITYRVHVTAKAVGGTRQMQIARGSSNALINSSPNYENVIGTMLFGTSYTTETLTYTVGASPTTPFQYFFMVVLADSEQMLIRDFWVEDITPLVDATSQATIATSQATIATAQAAAASSSAVLSASIGLNSLNKNPVFADWPGASGTLPNDWSDWYNGTTNTKTTGDLGGNAFQLSSTLGQNAGIARSPQGMHSIMDGGYFVLEGDVTLVSGTLAGAGVLLLKTGGEGRLDFAIHPDNTGAVVGAGTVGKRYSFRRLVQFATNGNRDYSLYCMTSWSGYDAAMPAKTLKWHRCSVRPATPQEIESLTVLAPLQATVTTQATAIATLEGYTEARWVTTAVAGTGRAQLAIYADANGGGGVDIIGDVKIDGDLLVTGSVTSTELGANAATRGGISVVDTSVALSESWQDAGEVTITMIGGAAKIDFSAYIVGQGVGSGTNVLWRLLRNGTQIRTGTLTLFPGEQTVYGGTVGENPYPVYTPVAGMFPAFYVDTSGPTGSVTYKIQLKVNSVASVSFADFAERSLSVTEFRR